LDEEEGEQNDDILENDKDNLNLVDLDKNLIKKLSNTNNYHDLSNNNDKIIKDSNYNNDEEQKAESEVDKFFELDPEKSLDIIEKNKID